MGAARKSVVRSLRGAGGYRSGLEEGCDRAPRLPKPEIRDLVGAGKAAVLMKAGAFEHRTVDRAFSARFVFLET
jgi:hypothetical protein